MSTVCRMIGKEWWLSKTGNGASARESYPDVIRVGQLGKERRYFPERTCRRVYDGNMHICSECRSPITSPVARFCKMCGAKVVDE